MNRKNMAFENEIVLPFDVRRLIVSSHDFIDDGYLPRQYTCDGANISPSLDISKIPPDAKSLALIVDDPYHPEHWWTHWIAWNIPPIRHIKEGRRMEAEGMNDYHLCGYYGPCPSSGVHRYHFKIYALDCFLQLPHTTNAADLQHALNGHILGIGQITGRYRRN